VVRFTVWQLYPRGKNLYTDWVEHNVKENNTTFPCREMNPDLKFELPKSIERTKPKLI